MSSVARLLHRPQHVQEVLVPLVGGELPHRGGDVFLPHLPRAVGIDGHAAAEPVEKPPAPDLGGQTTAASDTTQLAFPADGKIVRGYQKGKNDGIDIGASAGSAVKAAGNGTVAAITQDTDQVPILVIRHDGNLLTVYAGIDAIGVKKGDAVTRGQPVAKVRAGATPFLHFEVRKGFESVDPLPYLK